MRQDVGALLMSLKMTDEHVNTRNQRWCKQSSENM